MATSLTQEDAETSSQEQKKATATLLPPFEPLSSSPAWPKSLKRTRDLFEDKQSLPTPVPTSSTHILSSSPPRRPISANNSTLTERVPLGALPTLAVKGDGTTTRLGRSSQSCDYQLSSNRLISRVHAEITYFPAISRLQREKLEIQCQGWNGVKIHCQSKVYELKRGEVFSSDIRDAEIMLDVHDSRVMLQWPEKPHLGPTSSDEDELEVSPSKKQRPMRRHSTPPSPSPLQSRRKGPVSPVSPSPAVQELLPSSPPSFGAADRGAIVEIFEDPEPSKVDDEKDVSNEATQATQVLSQPSQGPRNSQDSELSSPQDFSDNDEENDPIIHSFGPFGANLLPKMASFHTTDSPHAPNSTKSSRSSHAEPLRPNPTPSQPLSQSLDFDVQSHVINQLAFSRLSSLPLSTIHSHLPHDAQVISPLELKKLIHETACIGEVAREGKDAAGKPLENEFYYLPDADDDVNRKEAVVNDLRKPGLRACRKQHKQYYWKKPK